MVLQPPLPPPPPPTHPPTQPHRLVQSLYISVVVAAIALLLMSNIVPHTLLQDHIVSLVSCFQSQQVEEASIQAQLEEQATTQAYQRINGCRPHIESIRSGRNISWSKWCARHRSQALHAPTSKPHPNPWRWRWMAWNPSLWRQRSARLLQSFAD